MSTNNAGWPVVKLGEIASLDYGAAFKSSSFNTEGRGLPVIRIRDVTRGFSETFYDGEYDDKYLVEDGDILIGMDGDFNIAKWQGGTALLNQRVCRVARTTVDEIDTQYLFHYLPIALQEIWHRTSYVTVKHLSAKELQKIQVPLPPLDEQRRIAVILDIAHHIVNSARKRIMSLRELPGQLFEIRFNADNFPRSKIGELLSETQYGTSKKAGEAGEFPVLRMGNVTFDGYLDYEELKYLNLAPSEMGKYTLRDGDLLFNRTNSKELVGKTAIYRGGDDEVAFAGYLIRCRVNDRVIPEYISGFLNSPTGKAMLRNRAKAIVGMANINANEVRSFEIPDVSLNHQESYAELTRKIEVILVKAEEQLGEMEEFQRSLSVRAFAGLLDRN